MPPEARRLPPPPQGERASPLRSVTRDGGAGRRGCRLRLDSAPPSRVPRSAAAGGASGAPTAPPPPRCAIRPRARAARLSPARREQAGDGLSSLHVPRRDESSAASCRPTRSATSQHCIQMVNTAGGSAFAVYRKSDGSLVAGPTMLGDLRAAGGPCASGYGDGIVLFDTLASRWLMAEFAAVGNHLCVYVSRTSDPLAGGWFSYDFPRDIAPDARRGHDRARERRDGRRGAARRGHRLPPEAGRVRRPARQSGASARVPAARLQLALRKGRDLPEPQRQYLLHIERTCREMMR